MEEEKPGEKKYNKKISLKIHVDLHVCTKQGVNLRMRCGNGSLFRCMLGLFWLLTGYFG
jgi:hypothetical protein